MAVSSGCKVGPDYLRPRSAVNADWSLVSHPRMQGEPALLHTWWAHFQDSNLDCLIHTTLQQNLTLREAGQHVLEARARRDVVAGNLFPQFQGATGAYSKSRLSTSTANFFTFPGVFTPDIRPENWSVGLAASWELDFWGRYRRAIESADASLDATCAAYDEARVLLLAEVAQTYVELRTIENRMGLARQNLEYQEQTLRIAQQKKEAGLGTSLDVAQAESIVGQTGAVLPDLEILRRQASHRLCVLLGRPPTDLSFELGNTGLIPHAPHNLAFGIPADLLRRRPDVRRAERNLAAQSAKIGIAEAEFYPHVSLTGNIGYAAEDFSDLFGSSSTAGLISPGFSWNLLNYGRIKNNVRAEQAAFEALCFAYQNAVLKAAQEAEDAQVAYVFGFDRADHLLRAVDGISTAVIKSQELYEAGSIDFGRIYVLQSDLLVQQDELAVARGQIALSLIELFKSLGGGWESTCYPLAGATQYSAAASYSPVLTESLQNEHASIHQLPKYPETQSTGQTMVIDHPQSGYTFETGTVLTQTATP